MEQNVKKKHTGLIVFLVILFILLLIPATVYGYLAISSKSAERQRCAYDPDAAYTGQPAYYEDGTAQVALDEGDVYWLLDHYDEMDKLLASYGEMIEGYSVKFREGGLVLNVNGKLFGFLPVPLTVTTDATCENGVVDATIREVRIGKLVNVPLEKLASFEIPEAFSFDLNDDDTFLEADDISFGADSIVISEPFLKDFAKSASTAAKKSCIGYAMYVYEGEAAYEGLPVLAAQLGQFPLQNSLDSSLGAMQFYIAGADDPAGEIAALLGLCTEERAAALYDGCDTFEKHFLLDPLLDEAAAARAANLARVTAGQTKYEGLLSAVREKYRSLGVMLSRTGYLDAETEEPLDLAALYPGVQLDPETTRILLLHSLEPLHAVDTAGMPALSDVPKKNRYVPVVPGGGVSYDKIPYDLGILITMPCGENAVLYKEAKQEFVINFIPADMVNEFCSAKSLTSYLSDMFPRPPTRDLCTSIGEGLTPYYTILYDPAVF